MKRRWAIRITLFLVVGAIVNVTVAWGCSAWSPVHYEPADQQSPADVEWARSVGFVDPLYVDSGHPIVIQRGAGLGVGICRVYPYALGGTLGANRYTAGWPLKSVQAHFVRSDVRQDWVLNDGYALPATIFGQQVFPYCPIWPGFAINTVFYAGLLWLLFAGPFALRRRRRIRRGLCPKCAYDLRGSKDASACPECGAAVRRHAFASTPPRKSGPA